MAKNDSIQKIKYSVTMQANPMKPDEPKKAYGKIQSTGTVSLKQLASHIKEHGSPYGRDVVIGVLTAIVDCTREFLIQGFSVDLGDLGKFVPSIKCEGASSYVNDAGETVSALKAFNSDNIVALKVNHTLGAVFEDLRDDAEFEKVATRKVQKAAEQAALNGATSADWSDPEEEEGGGD